MNYAVCKNMSGLETLPPDQRAVLQLILRQGRGYADLAGLLKIDVRAVRDRAHAGLAALGGPDAARLAPEHRARIADYVLGQQDDAERIVTLAELGESPGAATWARDLRAQLAPFASGPLPEIPAHEPVGTAVANGANGGVPASGAWHEIAPAPAPAAADATASPGRGERGAPRTSTASAAPRASRLGGAILLGAIAALLVAILLIVLLSGGGTKRHASSTASRSTPARTTSTQAQTQASAQPVAQANLTAAIPGGHALGVGVVEQANGQLVLAVQAEHLAANTPKDAYVMWLRGPAGTKLLGYVPNRVGSDGTFAVSAPLPSGTRSSYTTVLVSREPTSKVPAQPTTIVLSGALKWL